MLIQSFYFFSFDLDSASIDECPQLKIYFFCMERKLRDHDCNAFSIQHFVSCFKLVLYLGNQISLPDDSKSHDNKALWSKFCSRTVYGVAI